MTAATEIQAEYDRFIADSKTRRAEGSGVIKITCSNCKVEIGSKRGGEGDSHSLCPTCLEMACAESASLVAMELAR